jgi:hypothetical protein
MLGLAWLGLAWLARNAAPGSYDRQRRMSCLNKDFASGAKSSKISRSISALGIERIFGDALAAIMLLMN